MAGTADPQLSRRERQIMEVLYQCHRASVAQIRAALPEPPSYSAVRALLRILGEKGHVRHEEKDLRYVYFPTVPRGRVRRTALRRMVETFFDGSAAQAVAALLDPSTSRLTSDELDRIAKLIAKARGSVLISTVAPGLSPARAALKGGAISKLGHYQAREGDES
ncbi:MAG: BlaI/MecI/CopY family transcriptional regulator [Terriglobia bacterium]